MLFRHKHLVSCKRQICSFENGSSWKERKSKPYIECLAQHIVNLSNATFFPKEIKDHLSKKKNVHLIC